MRHVEFVQHIANRFSEHLQSDTSHIAYGALEYVAAEERWSGNCERVDFGAVLAELCWHDGDTNKPTPTVTMFADGRGVTALITAPDTADLRPVICAHYRKGTVTLRIVET